ncbi:hypothetical protein ABEB36_003085 [Hypothenemus hampei]|uniref:SRR1-like domain-containing protein n=1 Tax=Hypothenemus hampei TaxID=57062 RepID=A0ABD1FB43_HYPHA
MESNLENSELIFTKVSYKRKRKFKKNGKNTQDLTKNLFENYGFFDADKIMKKILEAKADLLESEFFNSIAIPLNEALTHIDNHKFSKIICLGLGRVSESKVSCHQMALLLCLKEIFDIEVYVSDPMFTDNDLFLLKYLKVQVDRSNVEENLQLYEVFNDTAIHVFHPERLESLYVNFWEDNDEPKYLDCDLEFISNKV